ncbi:RNA polymerase sigma-70 factor [Belliella marina]|uniref:RNA polymerase sigma-70 factor n=1 Tax=Belliella marina TaxID=1644146 RepID=A0ABW4VJI3_9BACT
MSKNEILENLNNGDQKAFKLLFDMLFYGFFGFAFRYVKNKETAEELVEDVMVLMWEKRGEFDDFDRMKAYLFAALRNKSLDYLKSNSKMILMEIGGLDVVEEDPFLIEEEFHALIYQALDALPDKCRKVFELSCLEGMKYKQISEELGISLNTVKSQRSRAIKLIKIYLGKYIVLLLLTFYFQNL